jgi:hypothetical protein
VVSDRSHQHVEQMTLAYDPAAGPASWTPVRGALREGFESFRLRTRHRSTLCSHPAWGRCSLLLSPCSLLDFSFAAGQRVCSEVLFSPRSQRSSYLQLPFRTCLSHDSGGLCALLCTRSLPRVRESPNVTDTVSGRQRARCCS